MKKIFYILTIVISVVLIVYFVFLQDIFIEQTDLKTIKESETLMNQNKKNLENLKNIRPMEKKKYDESEKFENGNIKIIKEEGFKEVSPKPKTPIQILQEMAKKKDKSPVKLKDEDLEKKIIVYEREEKNKVLISSIPLPGEETISKLSKFTAPVTYKIFTNINEWQIFLKYNKVRKIDTDFSNNNVLILVSNSDLPNGIFLIEKIEKRNDEVFIIYKINPLEMSTNNENHTQNYYSAINIPKNSKIKLEQSN